MKSKSDNSFVVLLLAVVIAFCCWFFGFNKMNAKSEELDNKIKTLDTQINTRTEYKKNNEEYKADTEKFTEAMAVYGEKFPTEVHAEDVLEIVRNINSLDNGSDENVMINIIEGKISKPEEVYSTKDSGIKGYMNKVTISFEYTSYEGFKKMLNYLNENEDRCNIVEYDAAYESLTEISSDTDALGVRGTLSGSVTFNVFYATGVGEDNNYEEPVAEGEYTFGGTENPFIPGNIDVTVTDTNTNQSGTGTINIDGK